MRLFCEAEGIDWTHRWLEAQDLEYHSTQPERSLALPMADLSGIWNTPDAEIACTQAPVNTRAKARSDLMKEIQTRKLPYVIDWDSVQANELEPIYLLDPFNPRAPALTDRW